MSRAEKFISEHTRKLTQYGDDYFLWITPDDARKAVEIAKEEELEYVKYQLDLRLPETLDYNGVQVNREDFINDFIKAMKDE